MDTTFRYILSFWFWAANPYGNKQHDLYHSKWLRPYYPELFLLEYLRHIFLFVAICFYWGLGIICNSARRGLPGYKESLFWKSYLSRILAFQSLREIACYCHMMHCILYNIFCSICCIIAKIAKITALIYFIIE